MAHDVFLSYRSEDKAAADHLCEGLESQGIACWIAPRNIPASAEWPTAIVEAIGACRVFVMVLSSNSKNAKQISREAELADKNGCRIVTFRIENVEPPPGLSYFLGNIQWLDAFGDRYDAALAQLAELIKNAPEKGTEASSPPAPKPIPPPASKPVQWTGAALACTVLIGVVAWFGFHRTQPVSPPAPADEMSQAKAVADRFLNERETGNLDAAWAHLADTFQNNTSKSKWQSLQMEQRQHGSVVNRFNGCTLGGNGYFCDYTLAYADHTSDRDKLWLIKDRDGSWKVARSEMRPLAKP